MTTTELSTSIPTETARPDREIMLMVTSEKYMSTMAKTTLRGMEQRVTKVGRRSRRNRKRMAMANTAPSRRLFKMELTMR